MKTDQLSNNKWFQQSKAAAGDSKLIASTGAFFNPPPPLPSTITPCISMTLIQSPVCFLYCVGSRKADWAIPFLFLAFAVICRQVGLQQQCDMRKLRVLCPVEGRQGRVPVNTSTRIPRPPARGANEETALVVHGRPCKALKTPGEHSPPVLERLSSGLWVGRAVVFAANGNAQKACRDRWTFCF